ncbi:MAG: hypothetical protein R3321_04660 [Nitrososphaeraceae archaeon]|nr:hypothetical protein [Nitrososphaeraceae archaeon]
MMTITKDWFIKFVDYTTKTGIVYTGQLISVSYVNGLIIANIKISQSAPRINSIVKNIPYNENGKNNSWKFFQKPHSS